MANDGPCCGLCEDTLPDGTKKELHCLDASLVDACVVDWLVPNVLRLSLHAPHQTAFEMVAVVTINLPLLQ